MIKQNRSSLRVFLESRLEAESMRWPLWIPIFFGAGLCLYFSLHFEPNIFFLFLLNFCFLLLIFLCRRRLLEKLLARALFLTALGALWGTLWTLWNSVVQLHKPLGPINLEGRVASVETLSLTRPYTRLVLEDLRRTNGLQSVRLVLRKRCPFSIEVGQRLRVRAKLLPFQGPTVPGGYDFRRQAFFQKLGASGYMVSVPVLREKAPSQGMLKKVRATITKNLYTNLPSPESSVACALITGEKSAIPEAVRTAFADSGLAHVLAISGLHLSIVAGCFFYGAQLFLILCPRLGVRVRSPVWASGLACLGTYAYLELSNRAVPVQRAWTMLALGLVASMFGRSALSVRTLACAAFGLMVASPHVVVHPSFQLSFAAVLALITAFDGDRSRKGFWMSMVVSTAVATFATAPLSIYTFNRFNAQSFVSNGLAIPLTTMAIIPLGIATCVSMLWGGWAWLWTAFGWSLKGLISVATWGATLPGASYAVAMPPSWAVPVWAFGGLWFAVWKGRWRWWGAGVMAVGLAGFWFPVKTRFLIDPESKILGVVDGPTLYVSSLRRGKYNATAWKRAFALSEVKLFPKDWILPNGFIFHDRFLSDAPNALSLRPRALRLNNKTVSTSGAVSINDQSRVSSEHGTRRPWTLKEEQS